MVLMFTEEAPKIKHSQGAKKKIQQRRGTRVVLPNDPRFAQLKKKKSKNVYSCTEVVVES
jgi:hypothetical protein